jgi:thiol-disulfide isomerase/thioredoxin
MLLKSAVIHEGLERKRMTLNYQRFMCGAFLLVGTLLFQPVPTLDASKGMILDQAYPGLASKILGKASLGGTSVEQAKEWIGEYLVERKRDEAVLAYVSTLVDDLNIRVDTDWTQKQSKTARDNPVDRALFSGKPTLVEFGATGCGPCDMMQPILEDLRQKFRERLNIVFVHVGEEPILSTRYGIDLIPVQVFFDRDGNEVYRHVGFMSENAIVTQLKNMGVN